MKQSGRKTIMGLVGGLALSGALAVGAPVAHAFPVLQLDIGGGFYDPVTETIMTSSDSFTLYALLNTTARGVDSAAISDTYYISVALSPQRHTGGSLGSFVFNGTTVNVTSDMTYGIPPIEASGVATHDAGDLAPHGVFPTYFSEFSFRFHPLNMSGMYNTADNPGGIRPGVGFLYAAFTVDRSLLASPYQLHFDLYSITTTTSRRGGVDRDINRFAPFSHDAGTTSRGVPEPSTLLLLGAGLAGMGIWRRKASKA